MRAYIILLKHGGNYFAIVDDKNLLAVMDRKDQCEKLIQAAIDKVKPTEEDLAKFEFSIFEVTSVAQVMKQVVGGNRKITRLREASIEFGVLVLGQDCKKAFNRGTKFLPRKIEETPVDV